MHLIKSTEPVSPCIQVNLLCKVRFSLISRTIIGAIAINSHFTRTARYILTSDTGLVTGVVIRCHNFRSKYDELERALLTVKCLLPALASLRNACRHGPHSLGKHYPLFYARLESFLTGNRPRQQSLVTLLGPRAQDLTITYWTTKYHHLSYNPLFYRQKPLVSLLVKSQRTAKVHRLPGFSVVYIKFTRVSYLIKLDYF